MATHSSVLAWRIPGMGKPGGLPSMGSHRVRHDWSDLAAAAAALFTREGNGTPLQYSCLENPMDGGASWAAVHVVAKSRTRLSDFTFTFHFHALEKEMATHSSVLAWRIPGTGLCGGLRSTGSHRVEQDWSDLAAAAAAALFTIAIICHMDFFHCGNFPSDRTCVFTLENYLDDQVHTICLRIFSWKWIRLEFQTQC